MTDGFPLGLRRILPADTARISVLLRDRLPELRAMLKSPGTFAATKLKTIANRVALRDYFDLVAIEQCTAITMEPALQDYQERYRTRDCNTLLHIIRALGTFSDFTDDPGLPVTRANIERYWTRRLRTLAFSINTTGTVTPHPSPAALTGPALATGGGAELPRTAGHGEPLERRQFERGLP